jgi:hypothetical protein
MKERVERVERVENERKRKRILVIYYSFKNILGGGYLYIMESYI